MAEKKQLFPDETSRDSKRHELFLEVIATQIEQTRIYTRIGDIDDELSECLIERCENVRSIEDCITARQKDLVYEDYFNSAITDIQLANEFSFKKLLETSKNYESAAEFQQHYRKCKKTYHLLKENLSDEDAKAAAFAIAFYTGSHSDGINRHTSLIIRQGNKRALLNTTIEYVSDVIIILHYLVKGLSHLPYYWGVCTRAVDLEDTDFAQYKPGNLITWTQFSSSRLGTAPPDHYAGRNTYFFIYSLSGRYIEQFSMFPEEEEVLFFPHSKFLVLQHELVNDKHLIYLRQVELGLAKWCVLWVADHSCDEHHQNKRYMEEASCFTTNNSIHFIPKTFAESAISFLRSKFGERLKNRPSFRLVTDMNRNNETSSEDAGVHFIKEMRKLGFKNDCLVYTSDCHKVKKKIQQNLNTKEINRVSVTSCPKKLYSFIVFDQERRSE